MSKYQRDFEYIVKPIMNHNEFLKLKDIGHHGITRYEHCFRVAYYTYYVTRLLHLNYREATRGALLHDFFIDEVDNEKAIFKLRRHPMVAVKNSVKYFDISEFEEDIIKTHMFPVTFTPPKYLESWIVDIIDDISAIYERGYYIKKELKTTAMFIIVFLLKYF